MLRVGLWGTQLLGSIRMESDVGWWAIPSLYSTLPKALFCKSKSHTEIAQYNDPSKPWISQKKIPLIE